MNREYPDEPFNVSKLADSEWLRFIAREDKDRMPPYYYRRLFKIARFLERLEELTGSLENAEKMCKAAMQEHIYYIAPYGPRPGGMNAYSLDLYRCCERGLERKRKSPK